jgi:UDP-N-acetylglucosamine 4,6-dehydratase
MKSVVITGGTGTFGRAMTKKLLEIGIERVCIFSRGEHTQAQMAMQLNSYKKQLRFFIGDVRDKDRLRRAFTGVDTVIHAAALKRIEVGHYNPIEMVRTNVDGAINVIEAALDSSVQKVVALSSDKAYHPVSAYGSSKALAESLFLAANNTRPKGGTRFSAVRYGNIWCSNGSVVPKWRDMQRNGAKVVPVTDPNCTRFFMRIEEAVALVLNTINTMQGGELNIPDLPAYRIGDLATAMGMQYEILGLPAWEKLHESMSDEASSDKARRMSIEELTEELKHG